MIRQQVGTPENSVKRVQLFTMVNICKSKRNWTIRELIIYFKPLRERFKSLIPSRSGRTVQPEVTENQANSPSSGVNSTVENSSNQGRPFSLRADDEICNGYGCYIINTKVDGEDDKSLRAELVFIFFGS